MMERGGARKKQQGNKKRFLKEDMKTREENMCVVRNRERDRLMREREIDK